MTRASMRLRHIVIFTALCVACVPGFAAPAQNLEPVSNPTRPVQNAGLAGQLLELPEKKLLLALVPLSVPLVIVPVAVPESLPFDAA